jgi:predicted metal-dependent enzyme (double-stranded beta helix superfamily)
MPYLRQNFLPKKRLKKKFFTAESAQIRKSAKNILIIRNNLRASPEMDTMLDLQHFDQAERFAHLSVLSQAPGADYLKAGRETLVRLLADPALLDGVTLTRVPGGYSRNLIFGDHRITVYAIVWSAGSQTSIHDHHCSCCYAILSGTLTEFWYKKLDGTHVAQSRAFTRATGEIACMLPTGPNLHKMLNASDDEAISIHIYGYDNETRASSIDCEYLACEPTASQ